MKIKVELTIDVELNGVSEREIKSNVRHGVQRMFGEGEITGPSEAEVESWNMEFVEGDQRAALAEFCDDIEATGGVVELEDGNYALVADEEWIDLADTYLKACKALGRRPEIKPGSADQVS